MSDSKRQIQDEHQDNSSDDTELSCDGGGQDQIQSKISASDALLCVTGVPCLSNKLTELPSESGIQEGRFCDTEKTCENQTSVDVDYGKDFQTTSTDRANPVNIDRVNNQEIFAPAINYSTLKEALQMPSSGIRKGKVGRVLTPKSNPSVISDINDAPSECMPVILSVRGNATDLDVTGEFNQTNHGDNFENHCNISPSLTSCQSLPEGPLVRKLDNLNTKADNMSQKNCIPATVANIPAEISSIFSRDNLNVLTMNLNAVSEMTLDNSATGSTKSSVSNSSRKKHSLPPSIYMNRTSVSLGSDSHSKILSNSYDKLPVDAEDAGKEPMKNVQSKRVYSLLEPRKSPPTFGVSQTTSTISSSSPEIISFSNLSSGCLSSERKNSCNSKLGELDSAIPSTSLDLLNPPATILVRSQRTGVTTSLTDNTLNHSEQPLYVIITGNDQDCQSSSTQIGQPEPERPLCSYDLLPESRGMNRQEILASGLLRVSKKSRTDLSKHHVCFVCGDEFYTEEFLQFHLTRNVFILTYFCRVCKKMCTFHNKCAFVQHILEEAVKRPLNLETTFMKLEPYLPPDPKTKSHNCKSQSDQSVVLNDNQSTTDFPYNETSSATTVVPIDQRVTPAIPGDQKVSTTVVPGYKRISTKAVYSDQRLSTTVVYSDQRLSTTVVPIDQGLLPKVVTSDQRISMSSVLGTTSSPKMSTIIVPTPQNILKSVIPVSRNISTSISNNQLSTIFVPIDHQITTVVSCDQQLSTTVVSSDQRLSTSALPNDQRSSTSVCSAQMSSTTVGPSAQISSTTELSYQRPSTKVVSSDNGPSQTLSSGVQAPSTTVVPSDQTSLTAVVQSRIWRSTKNNCPFCKRNFLTFSGLKSHFQRANNPTYSCTICQMELFNQCSLSAHISIHHPEHKGFVTCPECGETLQCSQDFRSVFEHLDSCGHFNVWYTIACTCKETFTSVVTLKEHFLDEHLQVRYQCNICNLVQPSMYVMYQHFSNKHKNNMCSASVILQCSLCKQNFNTPTALRLHVDKKIEIFKQTKQKVYQCIICLGVFASASDLNAHLEHFHIHKPKRCTLCFGLFMGRQSLVNHLVSKSCPKKFPKHLHLCLDIPSKRERTLDQNRYAKLFEVRSLDVVPTGVVVSVQQDVFTASTVNNIQNKATLPLARCSFTLPQRGKNSENCQTEKNSENNLSQTSKKSVSFKSSSSTSKHSAYDRSKHQCHLCKICLVGSHNFIKHMSHHKDIDSQTGRSHCVVCKKMVAETSFSAHMEEHQSRGIIVCTLCHRRDFPNMNLARDHSKNWCYYKEAEGWGEDFLKEKRNPLTQADGDSTEHSQNDKDSVSDSRDLSASYSRSENEPLVFPCLMCGLAFLSKSTKDDHVSRVHDGTKTFFLCSVCKRRGTRRAFNKKQKVSMHISRKHRITDATAISKLILEEVLNISNGQVIPSDVSSTENLEEPAPKRLRQEAEGTFLCGKCGFSNGQWDVFEQHIKTHNPKGEPQCPECGLCFTVSVALKKHLFAVHKIKNVEEYMRRRGIEEENVEELSSDEDCDIEVDIVPSVSVMEEYVDNPLKTCKTSKKKSSCVNINEIDSSMECNVCYKKFTSELVLKSHMRSHGMAFIRSRRDRNRDQNSAPQLESI